MRDKLESTDNWYKTQKEQSLEELIRRIERICIGFDDHKQDVFNGRNFKSLWGTVEAFGGSPGVHKGLVEGILKDPGWVKNVNSVTDAERRGAEQEVSNTVKAALVISGADKGREAQRQACKQLFAGYGPIP